MTKETKLHEDVIDIAKASTLDGNRLILPLERLSLERYKRFKAAMEKLGGKWKTGAQAFVFAGSAMDALGTVLNSGTFFDKKKEWQQFDTPEALADDLAMHGAINQGDIVLEPNVGMGALALAAKTVGAKVYGIDIDKDRLPSANVHCEATLCGDFLAITPATLPRGWPRQFTRILMNPPFHGSQDLAHVAHALQFLEPGGVLCSVMASGWDARRDKKSKAMLATFEDLITYDDEIEAGTFSESGTQVKSHFIVIHKPE